jgi:Ca2+-binding RTX toxin-like protein
MTTVTLAQPQVFDGTPSVAGGDWLRKLLGNPAAYTVDSATVDKVVLKIADAAFAGYSIAITPVDHFTLTPGAAQPFAGAIDSVVLLDRDGGTAAIAEDLPPSATLAGLGDGSILATWDLSIDGSDGADTIVGVAGGDLISGGGGADVLRGGFDDGGDVIMGGAGADTIDAGAGDDDIYAGDGPDLIDGGSGEDWVYLTETNTRVEAWFGQPAPAGGLRLEGVELAITNDAGSRLHGGTISETFIGGAGRDEFDGAAGDDVLAGLDGDDDLRGGEGDDVLDGGSGADLIDGGSGIDLVDYSTAGAAVVIDLRITGPQQTPLGLDTLVSIEGLFGGDYSDTLTGAGTDDILFGGVGEDQLVGGAGNDLLAGEEGGDRVFGGVGNDSIVDTSGVNYLRGDEGDDVIVGGTGFDDANGNMGNDTVATGAGDDYAVGGKDNDNLSGEAGGDVVWGNLGADTQDGGDGNDQVRGGQGDDTVTGGAGDDFVSGDRGNDTVAGGAGADLIHGSQDAGIDRVVDFNLAEGDRVMLDPGTTYTVSQVGADTVIDMGAGNQMILVGVQFSTLTPGWIFGA